MKGFKGCLNQSCKAYKDRIKYKSDFEYCPYCGSNIEYVCADCWTELAQNTHYCPDCQKKRDEKKAQQVAQGKKVVKGVVQVAPAVWGKRDAIIKGGKQVAKFLKK